MRTKVRWKGKILLFWGDKESKYRFFQYLVEENIK